MLMAKETRPAIRTLRGRAINVLQEAGAILECEEHGRAKDRADPHAREHALEIARQEPPDGLSPDQAAAEVILNSIGDTCPLRLSGLLRLRRDKVVTLFVDEVQQPGSSPSVA